MSGRVSIDRMADAIMEGLTEYAGLATDGMKAAVQKSAKTVKREIPPTINRPAHLRPVYVRHDHLRGRQAAYLRGRPYPGRQNGMAGVYG
ncbi:MAG: hypothetical protein K5990_04710 [Oscillospiraceae bacterium]|nr:hypothetical protein [Oscillospiraceae bacterium]